MATADDTTATSGTDSNGWTAEVEARRHFRSKYPTSFRKHHLYPTGPDPARAEHFDPDGTHADYCLNDELKALDGLNVYDDRLVVPLEATRALSNRDADNDAHRTALDDLLNDAFRKMRIGETEKGAFYCADAGKRSPPHRTGDPDETDPRPIYLRLPRDHRLNKLHQLYRKRRDDGRTLLVIVIARDAATGTGKTTLACQLAKAWDTNGWTADRATLDPGTYADKYTDPDTPSKSVLLLDEAEQAADNRRSMSNQNVKLSHLWATMRFREIYSIITLPSASMLDKRLKELADVKIVVHNRGTAVAYKTKIDDHDGSYRAKRLCRLRWEPMDDDPQYQRLTDKKADRMRNYAETFSYGGDDADDDEADPDQIRRDYRRQVIERMSAAGYTQAEIADGLPDISDRSTVSKILNSDG